MSNQAPKAIDWNVDEEVVKAVFPDASRWRFGNYKDGDCVYKIFDSRFAHEGQQPLGVEGDDDAAWSSARLHPEVARLDAARNAVLAVHTQAHAITTVHAACTPDQKTVWLITVPGKGRLSEYFPTEVSAWLDAPTRLSPVLSVEACDQPKVSGTHIPQEITHNPVYGTFVAGSFPEKGFVYKLESSQSHPSLQESGDASKLRAESTDSEWRMYLAYSEGYAEAKNGHAETTLSGFLSLILPKLSKSPEPPAGPAFEEWHAANPFITNRSHEDRMVKFNRKLAWDAALASTPIDLNATREEKGSK